MKKRAFLSLFVMIPLALLLLASCSAPVTKAAATPADAAKSFLWAMFEFQDFHITMDSSGLPDEKKLQKQMNDKFGGNATADLVGKLIMNRMPYEFISLASQSKCRVTPGEITLNMTSEDKDMTSYVFSINLDLAFSGKKEPEQISVSGQMNVKALNGTYLVSDFTLSNGKDLYGKLQSGQ